MIIRDDGKKYIGETKNLKRRLHEHELTERFKGRISDYIILAEVDTFDEARKLEAAFIIEHDTYKNGLNESHDEQRERLRQNGKKSVKIPQSTIDDIRKHFVEQNDQELTKCVGQIARNGRLTTTHLHNIITGKMR
jgi:predicted GIY-YIG superfamily endonuclease